MTTLIENKLYCVEVPSDATLWKIDTLKEDEEFEEMTILMFDNLEYIELPSSNFKILGEITKNEISFDTGLFVRNKSLVGRKVFYDYVLECGYFEESNESFRSLLQSKGIDLNKENVKWVILLRNIQQ